MRAATTLRVKVKFLLSAWPVWNTNCDAIGLSSSVSDKARSRLPSREPSKRPTNTMATKLTRNPERAPAEAVRQLNPANSRVHQGSSLDHVDLAVILVPQVRLASPFLPNLATAHLDLRDHQDRPEGTERMDL